MTKSVRRVGTVAATAAVLALGVSACTTPATETAPTTPAATPDATVTAPVTPEQPTAAVDMCEGVTGTVDFRWWGGDARAALQMEAIAAFEARYPGITIVPQPMDLAGYRDRLTVEAAGGNLVDVATYNVEWLSAFGGDNGVLMNLSESPFIDLAPIEHALGEVSFDGSVFALPTGMTAPAIFANKAIFDEAGVAMPNDDTWSWDEMIAIAQEISDAGLTNENGESVFGMSNLGGQIVARVWANQTDGGMFAEDGTVNWTTDSIERYFTMVNDMIESGALPSAALQSETSPLSLPEQLMPLGRAALQPQWSNQVGAIVSASGENAEIEVLRFPGDSTEAHNGTWLRPTMTFAISETAQSPEAAACFVNWMVNDVEAGQIMGIDRGIPLNPEVYDAVISNLTNPNDLKQAAFVERIAARPGIAIPVPEISDDLQATLLTPSESAMFMRQSIADAAATLRTNLEGILVR